jgi:hypothetical protein
MTKKLALLVLLGGLVAGILPALAQQSGNSAQANQVAGEIMVSEYGKWSIQTLSPMTAGVASTVNLAPCFVHVGTGNRQIFPFWAQNNYSLNVPIQVQDGTLSETITSESAASYPTTATVPPTVQPYTCSVTVTPTNSHAAGVTITSGDGGMAEAINDALSLGAASVTIDPAASLPSSYPASTVVYPNVQIVDKRAPRVQYWNPQPTSAATTSTGAPAVRTATAACPATLLATTVCDSTVAVASGGFTNAAQYVWVAYVDLLGGVSQASATAHYTSAGALDIFFNAPAAATGQVGYIVGVGLSYATAYWFPMTSAYCTLTTIETVTPACALANATYSQAGSNAFIPKPLTTFALYPAAGGVANAYNPNPQNHTTFAYVPSQRPSLGFQTEYGPFNATAALTAGQLGVLGTVILPTGYLNYIPRDLELHGKFNYTPTTGGTAPEVLVEIGDVTDFTTGTPKALCTLLEVHTTTTAAYSVDFTCTLQTQATGTTGTIQPGGFLVDGLEAGTTLAIVAPEQDTGAITADVQDQDLLFIVFSQTSSAETTGPTLQKLTINQIN